MISICFWQKNLNVLCIAETKRSFPDNQFMIDGFSIPYRLDRNSYGGGVIIYVREDIPSKLLTSFCFTNVIEGIFVEINFRKSKWLLCGTYNPPSQCDQYFFDSISLGLDFFCIYEKILLVGDFNAKIGEAVFDHFLDQYDLKAVNKEPTCYKNVNNPSRIDFILTNNPKSFYNTKTIPIGLSDYHQLVLSIFKTTFVKAAPKEMIYRDFKNFDQNVFDEEVSGNFFKENIKSYKTFEENFLQALNKFAPLKKKVLRANHAPYVTKKMRKAIMKRSKLENEYIKKKTSESLRIYKKQKNYCSRLYKRERKSYYNNLHVTDIIDNKMFWKNIQPFFSEKRKNINIIFS